MPPCFFIRENLTPQALLHEAGNIFFEYLGISRSCGKLMQRVPSEFHSNVDNRGAGGTCGERGLHDDQGGTWHPGNRESGPNLKSL